METFEGKCDPQRLAKLEKRVAPADTPQAIVATSLVTPDLMAQPLTSESDNSQNEVLNQNETSNDPERKNQTGVPMTPDSNTKRPRKRKQDTPQDSRNIRPIKNQRPINAYFETNTENKTPGRTRDNGVSRNLLGHNDASSDYGITPIEPQTNGTPTQRKRRVPPITRDQTCQTGMTLHEIERLENGQAQKASAEKDDLVRQNLRMECELRNAKADKDSSSEKFLKCIELTKKMLIDKCHTERREARRKSMEDKLRLGDWNHRSYNDREAKWISGTAFVDLEERESRLDGIRKEIEKERRELSKRKPPSMATAQNASHKHRENALSAEEYYSEELILKNRLNQLKKEEQDVQYEREKLSSLRSLHIREMKRIQYEDVSKYRNNIELNGRYLLLNLIGKGGFSEVYKAYDYQDQMMVAIKIHQINPEWPEQKKSDYQKHARREAQIQKSIKHSKIIRLYDVFDVDINTFCTVMEYCEGNDLDLYLKQQNKNQISETEAKTVIMQIVQALKYLNELDKPVIHYDLKPGNILLADGAVCGNIKITDFGLSKQNTHGDEGIELTSQGAGTYWYLPPECFTRANDRAPKIDNRVDVWSIGVIFFQCIYGKKPFGNNQSQQEILERKTIVNANEVTFPARPLLSPDAKDFIRACLIYRKEDRADIFTLASHSYLKPTIRRSASNKVININENSN